MKGLLDGLAGSIKAELTEIEEQSRAASQVTWLDESKLADLRRKRDDTSDAAGVAGQLEFAVINNVDGLMAALRDIYARRGDCLGSWLEFYINHPDLSPQEKGFSRSDDKGADVWGLCIEPGKSYDFKEISEGKYKRVN
jgi:hypothetical protein